MEILKVGNKLIQLRLKYFFNCLYKKKQKFYFKIPNQYKYENEVFIYVLVCQQIPHINNNKRLVFI